MKKTLTFLILAILAFSVLPEPSFGHGSGSETLPAKMLDNRKVAMKVKSSVNNATNQKQIIFTMFDTNTGITVRDAVYHIKSIKDNKILFEGDFNADNGMLRFDLIPIDSEQIKVEKKQGTGFIGALLGIKENVVKVQGKTFQNGGLYKFEIDVISAENYTTKPERQVRFDAGISFLESSTITVDTDSGKQQIKIVSYYDILYSTDYNEDSRSISFLMPFDWSDSGINQTSIVHQEVFIPKSFAEILATKYASQVNEIPLPDNALTVDDYSNLDYRIIHIILNNVMLQNLKQNGASQDMEFSLQPSKENSFPVTRYTANSEYKINLSWDPPTIFSGADVRFFFTIQEAYLITNKTVSANYDLEISHDDQVLFKTGGTTTEKQNAKNSITVPIPDKITGPIIVKFENIGGNNLANAEFLATIEKQAARPMFPVKLTSVLPNSKEGNYNVDLTWFPSEISTNEQTEFVLTIKDKTDRPIPQSTLDFVILQKGSELFRQSKVAPAGGTYVDYKFLSEQEGPTTLRIENINDSNESIELTVVVTPEFPFGVGIAMVLAIGMMTALTRFKKYKSIS